jgi:amino acid transporter
LFFAALKILLIVGLIVAGIVVDLGGSPNGDRIGFRYWKNPGPFNEYIVPGNTGKFLGFWSSLISAAYSYANIQVVAIAGAETKNPRVIIPNAIRMTFWRVLIFYVVSILIVGMLVPSNDPNLGISTGDAQQSPFVIAFQRAGIKVLPSIINAIVCTSAFSCGSACVFLASRTLYGLAEDEQAPKFLLRTNRFGTPYFAVGASLIFMPLVYLSLGSNSSVVFGWFVNITTIAGLIGWLVIEITYLRFYYALKVQGIDRERKSTTVPLDEDEDNANLSRSRIQESLSAISSMDHRRRASPCHLVFRIQRLLSRSLERGRLSYVLRRRCHLHLPLDRRILLREVWNYRIARC